MKKYPVLVIKQHNKIIYSIKVKGGEILDFASISRIRRNEEGVLEGYQRTEVTRHIEEITTYLNTDNAILPNAVVVCFSKDIKFEPISKNSDFGYLHIPSGKNKCGWIVDGQQRVSAMAQSDSEEFEVVVNAFVAVNPSEQLEQFILVNNTKPLPKSLIYELLPEIKTEIPKGLIDKKLPIRLIIELNTRPCSPFYKRIKTHTFPQGYIKDNSIIKALTHSLVDGALFDYRANIITGLTEDDIESMLSILCAFWGGVKETFSEDWELPPTKTRLTHGVGIIALSQVMDNTAAQIRKEAYIQKDFIPTLVKLKPHCNWSSGYWDFGDSKIATLDIQNTGSNITKVCNFICSKL